MTDRYMPADWALPRLDAVNRAFFTSGALMLQRCRSCGQVQHPPIDLCHGCQADDFEYVESAGTGVVDDVTIVHHAGDARLRPRLPYNVVVVALDDFPGVLIVGNVVNDDGGLDIGRRVRCVFAVVLDEETGEKLELPQWELMPYQHES